MKRKRKTQSDEEEKTKPPRELRHLIDPKAVSAYLKSMTKPTGNQAIQNTQTYLQMFHYDSAVITPEFCDLVVRALDWHVHQIILVLDEMQDWKNPKLDTNGSTITGAVITQAFQHIDSLGNSKN